MTGIASGPGLEGRSGSNPLAVIAFGAALVGLLGFVLGFGALGWIADDQLGSARVVRLLFLIWAVIALVLGILGRTASREHDGRGKGLATAAVVIAIVELVGAVYFAFAITACINDPFHCR